MPSTNDLQVLGYQRPNINANPQNRLVILGYCGGLVLAAALTSAAILTFALLTSHIPPAAAVVPCFWLVPQLVLGAVIMEASLSLKTKVFPRVRFSRLRVAVLWGLAAGLLSPMPLFFMFLMGVPQPMALAVFLVFLLSQFLLPAMAGHFLCQRLPDVE